MKLKLLLLTFLLIMVVSGVSWAQVDTTFWFAVPDQNDAYDKPVSLKVNTFNKSAVVTISMPANPAFTPIEQDIDANSVYSFDLTSLLATISNSEVDTVTNKGLLITATAKISAYYEKGALTNPDLFALKGGNALGTNFVVTSIKKNWVVNDACALLVVASEDGTTVTITPSVNLVGHLKADGPFTVTLNKGQVYSARSAQTGNATYNVGGTIVTSDKPIAVTMANDHQGTPTGCGDINGDQLVPVNMAGNFFITLPGGLTVNGITDLVYVYATEDNTEVTVNGTIVDTIDLGGFYEIESYNNTFVINTDKPVLLYQLGGFGCEGGGGVIPQLDCTGSTTVGVQRSTTETCTLNLLVKSGDENGFTFNGSSSLIQGSSFSDVPNTNGAWKWAIISFNTTAFPAGTGGIVKNKKPFHLGFINGSGGGGTRYGYFSGFGAFEPNAFVDANGPQGLLYTDLEGTAYQWFHAQDVNGPFTPVSGALTDTLRTFITGFYYVEVTYDDNCPPVKSETVELRFESKLCKPTLSETQSSFITQTKINTQSYLTAASGYYDLIGYAAPVPVTANSNINLEVTGSGSSLGMQRIEVYIDYNSNNYLKDAGEKVFTGIHNFSSSLTYVTSFLLPAKALNGEKIQARMVVRPSQDSTFMSCEGDGTVNAIDFALKISGGLANYKVTLAIEEENEGDAGQVTTLPQGLYSGLEIFCANFAKDSTVTFLANNSGAGGFSHWSGDASGSLLVTLVQINAEKSVTANFISCLVPTDAGEVAGIQTICPNTGASKLTSVSVASGGVGILEYRWQRSTTSGTSGFTDITNSDSMAYSPGILSQTTWYRRLANVNCFSDWTDAAVSNTIKVTVEDITPPTITCPSTQTLVLGATCSAALPDYRNLATNVNDNCAVDSVSQSPAPGTVVSGSGPMTVTLTVLDVNGLSTSCTFTVNKVDTTPPAINCSNTTIRFNGETSIPITVSDVVTASDNCGVASIVLTPSSISCEQLGQVVPVQIVVTDINGNISACMVQVTVRGLPCGWRHNTGSVGTCTSDIDYNPVTGQWPSNATNCRYGSPFTSDKLMFAQYQLCGDGSITAQVIGLDGAQPYAGITMRESNDVGSKKVQLMINRISNILRREVRSSTGAQCFPTEFPSPCERTWLRIVRTGNIFRGYTSQDGQTWWYVMQVHVPMNSCIEIGLVLTNMQNNIQGNGTFANVSVTGGQQGPSVLSPGIEQAQDPDQGLDVRVYPNPVAGELQVDLSAYMGRRVELALYDIQGQQLMVRDMGEVGADTESIDMSGLPAGVYQLQVRTPGAAVVSRRVIVQKK
jgi:hypothetical protein